MCSLESCKRFGGHVGVDYDTRRSAQCHASELTPSILRTQASGNDGLTLLYRYGDVQILLVDHSPFAQDIRYISSFTIVHIGVQPLAQRQHASWHWQRLHGSGSLVPRNRHVHSQLFVGAKADIAQVLDGELAAVARRCSAQLYLRQSRVAWLHDSESSGM